MRRYYNNSYQPEEPCAVALGNFDGVHRGHTFIIKRMMQAARELGLRSVVWTFDKHPENVMAGSIVSPLITTNQIKLSLMEELGVSDLVLARFTKRVCALSPEEFVDEILVRKLDARYVVCGFNYHFGHQGLGTSELLLDLCAQRGIQVEIVQPVSYQGEVVSSSHIRELIMEGRMEEASTLLGHPFTIQTKVIGGQKLARKLGFPTINQQFSPENIVPAHGVYVTIVEIRGKPYQGVTNVGFRPTVNGTSLTAETHVFGFSGNLYGSKIRVNFIKMLRPEKKFESVEKLADQVQRDIDATIRYFENEAGN